MRRIAILAEGVLDGHYAGQTVARLIRDGEDPIVAVIDSTKAGVDVSQAFNVSYGQGIPIVRDIMEALSYQPDTLFVVTIPLSSRYLHDPLRWQVLHAIHSGLDITAFSIDFLINDEEISYLAEDKGVSIYVDKPQKRTPKTQQNTLEELRGKILEEAKAFVFQLSHVSYPLDDYEKGSIRFHYEKALDALEAQQELEDTEEYAKLAQLTDDLDILYALVVRGDPQQDTFQKNVEEEIRHLDHPMFLRFIYSYLAEASQALPNGDIVSEMYQRTHSTFFNQAAYSYVYDTPEIRRNLLDFSNIKFVRTDDLIRGLLWHVTDKMLIGIAEHQSKETLLSELFYRLNKLNNIYGILTPAEMKRLEAAIGERQIPGVEAPGIQLWQAIKPIVTQPAQLGTRPILNEQSQTLLETYLTTNKSMRDLVGIQPGITTMPGVRKNLYTSLGRVWEYLPQEARQGYQSPEEAIQAVIASPIKTEETRRKKQENDRPSWNEDKPRQTGKHSQKGITGMRGKVGEHPGGRGKQRESREFTDTHLQHLSDGASRRWQRQREMSQAESNGNTPN